MLTPVASLTICRRDVSDVMYFVEVEYMWSVAWILIDYGGVVGGVGWGAVLRAIKDLPGGRLRAHERRDWL